MHWNTRIFAPSSAEMQHAAIRCNTMQRAATRGNTLQHAATHYNTRTFATSAADTCKKSKIHRMHFNAMQHTSTHCNTLQRAAKYCNTLQHAATHCNALHCTATYCNALQHTATHCTALRRTATDCNRLQHTSLNCTALHCTATRCNALQHPCSHLPHKNKAPTKTVTEERQWRGQNVNEVIQVIDESINLGPWLRHLYYKDLGICYTKTKSNLSNRWMKQSGSMTKSFALQKQNPQQRLWLNNDEDGNQTCMNKSYRVANTHRMPSVASHFSQKRGTNYRSLLREMAH